MKKRAVSAILTIVMIFTLTISASAANVTTTESYGQLTVDINEEIERALKGETDLDFDTSDIASAMLIKADGTTEVVDIYVTTRELQTRGYANEDVSVYATTVVAQAKIKSEVASNERDCVTGTLTLYWRDNFGMENDFEGVSGSWVAVKNPDTQKVPSLSKRGVEVATYGPLTAGTHQTYKENPSSNTFYIAKGVVSDNFLGYKATSWVTINGANILTVKVSTSAFS